MIGTTLEVKYNVNKKIFLTSHSQTKFNRDKDCKILKLLQDKKELKKAIETCFLVDKGHKDGMELHIILKDSTIVILNHSTNKFITMLYARPKQILRYYNKVGKQAPKELMKHAKKNIELGRNYL